METRCSASRWTQGLLSPEVSIRMRTSALSAFACCSSPPVASDSSSGCGAITMTRALGRNGHGVGAERRESEGLKALIDGFGEDQRGAAILVGRLISVAAGAEKARARDGQVIERSVGGS